MAPSLKTLWQATGATITELFYTKEPSFTEAQYPDLSNEVWVVTGGSGGIGYEVALRLAQRHAKVWLVARSQQKLEQTVAKIRTEMPSADLDYCVVDFADLESFKPGLAKLLKSETKIHGIIHNAGVMFPEKGLKTKQGYEYQVGVNNLGPQLLQKLLDPLVDSVVHDSGKAARIVWVSSLALFMSGYDFSNANDVTQSLSDRYAFSKAINYVQCVQWSSHHTSSNAISVAVHPGIIETDLFRHTDSLSNMLVSKFKWPAKYGAYSELYAALSPEVEETNNCFVFPFGRIGNVSTELYERAHDNRGEELWDWLEAQIKDFE